MIESSFIRALHKKLPMEIYHWKVSDRFTNGVPDAYYSSKKGDLWVEYKYYPKLPKTITPKLTKLQKDWLISRHEEGRRVAVIIGSPTECAVYENPTLTTPVRMSREDLIEWFKAQLC